MHGTIKRVETKAGKVDRQICGYNTNNITMIVKVTNQKIRQSPEPTTQNNPQYVTQWQPVEHLFTNSCLNLPKKENLRDILNLS